MTSRKTPILWNKADFKWNDNSFTWDDVQLLKRAAGEDWNTWEQEDKKKLIKLILKVYGDTITESKKREIKQYKITAKDIKLVVDKANIELMAENISF